MTVPGTRPADQPIGDDLSQIQIPAATPYIELGLTGLKRNSGVIDEEFLPALRGRKGVQVYREMGDNSAIVGSFLFSISELIGNIDWNVEPANSSAQGRKDAEFVEQCRDDMEHSWSDFINEAMSMVQFGWSWHEIIYKKRIGPWEHDLRKKSKYDDGLIGWRKMPIRSQESLFRWMFDKNGDVAAMVQIPSPTYQQYVLPMKKSLLFRTRIAKGNPEGYSYLRRAYRSYWLAKRIEEIEAVGVERDLAGLPVAWLPAEMMNANATPDQKKTMENFRKMVRSVRRDENDGLIMPLQYDEKGNKTYDFSLLTSGGSRQFNTTEIIQRHEQRILMQVMADFILVGHEGVGSYSMHTDKTGLFRTALDSLAKRIADVLNTKAIPRLFALNGMQPDELPKFVPGKVDSPDLAQLATFMSAMASLGVTWFPDPKLEKFVRQIADLPDLDEQTEAMLEAEKRQAQIIGFAQQRLQGMQVEQQAAQGAAATDQAQAGAQQAQAGAVQAGAQAQMATQQAAAPAANGKSNGKVNGKVTSGAKK